MGGGYFVAKKFYMEEVQMGKGERRVERHVIY